MYLEPDLDILKAYSKDTSKITISGFSLWMYTLKFDGSSSSTTFHTHISIGYHPCWVLS